MKLRVLCREDNIGALQCGVDLPPAYKTFDIEAPPRMAQWFHAGAHANVACHIIGVEIAEEPETSL